ncbi:class I SAM-dependent methyltransferase [Kutzneria sp. NPDC052558]|uniref:class I SAM-dependent methyltransferase n=1 Tax=Kutzneria sp. NPDC052558 TaxID=3364121 RepID=UPI0037CB3F0C
MSLSDTQIPVELMARAVAASGFMPVHEGLALYAAVRDHVGAGLVVEIGSYCGKSTIFLAAAARLTGATIVTVDHHRGSEEHQPGWQYHDPSLVEPLSGRLDTLFRFRRTIAEAGLEEQVVAVVGRSAAVASFWRSPLTMLFVDGGHTDDAARADYEGWAPWLVAGGVLAIHDVFEDPRDGGQAPYRIFRRAVDGGEFEQFRRVGSLRLLRRVSGRLGAPAR